MDDLFLFADSRAQLRTVRQAAGEWLLQERGLRLKRPEAPVLSCGGHLDALGRRITRDAILPHPRALKRLSSAAWKAVHRGERVRALGRWTDSVESRLGNLLFP